MKQIKLFGVLAIAMTLGLAACNQPAEPGNDSKGGDVSSVIDASTKHKHEYGEWTTTKEATCTEDGEQQRTCKGCGDVQTKVIKAAHQWGEWTTTKEATCQEKGSKQRTCSRCNEVDVEEIPLADHNYVADETATDVAPTCTEAGTENLVCSVCGDKKVNTVPATGHTWGEWETVKEPTCDVKGSQKHTCSVCNTVESEDIAELGHDLELVGGEQQAPAGEATVRLYKCKRCNIQYLGFKADEPSEASKPHLMEGANGGMRFFGRPIGNAMALTADGTSVNQKDNEIVYCSTETGDFFEYVFTLNKEQAETLSTCRLYCDARPADHLSGDFWAYGRSATDWTPGYYIDGADEHVQKNEDGSVMMVKDHAQAVKQDDGSYAEGVELETEVKMGARIEDYRYVLYVDDKIQQFDADTAVRAEGSGTNMVRKEYVLPFTFHLHEGQNKISLRMAGGYRSEFYNFIFRPYVEPTQITVNEDKIEVREGKTAQITSTMEGLTFKSSSNSVCTVDEKGVVTGVKAGTATITVSKEGNYKDAKVPVTVLEKEGVVALNLYDGVLAPEDGAAKYNSSYSGEWLRNFAKDTTLTYTFTSELAGKYDIQLGLRGTIADLSTVMAIKVNDADVAVSGSVDSSSASVDTIVGQANLKVGENKMVITILAADSGLYLKTLKLTPAAAEPAHTHEFGTPAAQTDEAESTIASCECGMKHIKWNSKKFNAEASVVGTPDSSENGSTGIKFGGSVYNKTSGTASTGDHVVYNVNVPEASASAKLYMRFNRKDAVSAFSAPSGDQSPAYYQNEGGEWVKYPWRYKLFINDVEVPFVPYAEGAEPQTVAKKEVEYAFPCTFALKAGVNKVELQKWGGYTATIVDFTFEYGA